MFKSMGFPTHTRKKYCGGSVSILYEPQHLFMQRVPDNLLFPFHLSNLFVPQNSQTFLNFILSFTFPFIAGGENQKGGSPNWLTTFCL